MVETGVSTLSIVLFYIFIIEIYAIEQKMTLVSMITHITFEKCFLGNAQVFQLDPF